MSDWLNSLINAGLMLLNKYKLYNPMKNLHIYNKENDRHGLVNELLAY